MASTLFGLAITIGLHYYKGMVMGLAIQACMAPLNLFENPLVKALIFGKGLRIEDKIFDEKSLQDLTLEDEVVDGQGNPVVRAGVAASQNTTLTDQKTEGTATSAAPASFEDILLDTWDMGSKADLGPLMKAINKKNCNYQTKESRWTPLMILAGLGAKGTPSAIRQVKELGANPAITDGEGWNALHWAAFHGSVEAAKELRKETKLLSSTDKEGKTPAEMARQEGNDDVADVFEAALGESKKSK